MVIIAVADPETRWGRGAWEAGVIYYRVLRARPYHAHFMECCFLHTYFTTTREGGIGPLEGALAY